MKQWISALLLCAMVFCFPRAVCAAEAPETGAEAMVL